MRLYVKPFVVAWLLALLLPGCVPMSSVQIVVSRSTDTAALRKLHLDLERVLESHNFVRSRLVDSQLERREDSGYILSFFADPASPTDPGTLWGVTVTTDRRNGELRVSLGQTTTKPSDGMIVRSREILALVKVAAPAAHIDQ
jgi:hypothetical protein